jgi:5'-nucleotidase
MSNNEPTILFTNDDGIDSPGLWSSVRAFEGLGHRLVSAPAKQQSGTGRSVVAGLSGSIIHLPTPAGETWQAYSVDGTPAQTVQYGLKELTKERPSLVVSGINYGDNSGNGVTISGTVGAAIEAAATGIPALAVSQETTKEDHESYSTEVDFSVAAHFARFFGKWLLENKAPHDIDFLKIDIPINATLETPWRVTRHSKHRTYWPTFPERKSPEEPGRMGYEKNVDAAATELNSDVRTLLHEGIISVTPMSIDMTARTNLDDLRHLFTQNGEKP